MSHGHRSIMDNESKVTVDKFFPKFWECLDCKEKISLTMDSFLPPCCGVGIVCFNCYTKEQKEIRCRLCGKETPFARIRAMFFRNVEETAWTLVEEVVKGNGRELVKETRGKGGFVYENMRVAADSYAGAILDEVYQFIGKHNHKSNCVPYQNIAYICDSVAKIREKSYKGVESRITIHDVLTFLCAHCGHGNMNKCITNGGEIRNTETHKMHNCKTECCGDYLDRRNLQYGGECDCGIHIMFKLGIEPATDQQHNWRKMMYIRKIGAREVQEVKDALGQMIKEMRIIKPIMLVWFVASKGPEYLRELLAREKRAIYEILWDIVHGINSEYGIHQPIQWKG